jgi:hypothetical protein
MISLYHLWLTLSMLSWKQKLITAQLAVSCLLNADQERNPSYQQIQL